jgi:hypothetical protein
MQDWQAALRSPAIAPALRIIDAVTFVKTWSPQAD